MTRTSAVPDVTITDARRLHPLNASSSPNISYEPSTKYSIAFLRFCVQTESGFPLLGEILRFIYVVSMFL